MRAGAWAQANDIFCEWLDRPAEEVSLLLHQLKTNDPNVGGLVSDLLEADRDRESFSGIDLSSLVIDAEPDESPDPWIGAQLGPYHIDSLLGSGGMGAVYLATHVDFRGPAAVKILSDSLSQERRARFEYEKKHLGQLNHPSIAKIFHADVHEDGTLFFAMEYVEGKSIVAYCDDEALNFRQRLQLVLQVCEAVQVAHSKRIIHRDIKPSNLLVTPEGIVKLLDFGIAEAADADSLLELNFISLPYASPEYEDAPPSIASDIYSLGILLYEVVTGRLPFSTAGKSRKQIRALVRAGGFASPSESCGKDRLRELSRLQWRELDWIFSKATALQPNDRYVTTDSLARDLKAFLEDAPLVMPDLPVLYRARKFIRRYRASVALSFAAVAALVLIVAVYTMQLREARNRALATAAQAAKLTKFDHQMFDFVGNDSGPAQGVTAVGMLDRSVPLVDAMHDDPATQAEIYNFLGIDYSDLSAYDKADSVLRRALALDEKTWGKDSVQAAKTMVALSQLRSLQGLGEEAEQLAQRAFAIESRNLPQEDRARLEAEEVLGEAYEGLNKNEEAVILEQSLIKRIKGEENLDLLSAAYNTLSMAEWNMGHDEEALAANQASLEIDRKIYGDTNPNIAGHLMTTAAIKMKRGDYAAAIDNYRAAIAIYSRWFGANDPQTADAQVALGEMLEKIGKPGEALTLLEAALPIEKKVWSDATPPITRAHFALGLIARDLGDRRVARHYFEEALAGYRVLDPNGSTRTATVLYQLAKLDLAEKRYTTADAKVREAVALDTKILGLNDLYTMRSILLSSVVFKAEGLDAEAQSAFSSVCARPVPALAAEARSRACAEYREAKDAESRLIAKTRVAAKVKASRRR
jgi:serine/threonine-protein kinase